MTQFGFFEDGKPQNKVTPLITSSHSCFNVVQRASSSPFSRLLKISMYWSAM